MPALLGIRRNETSRVFVDLPREFARGFSGAGPVVVVVGGEGGGSIGGEEKRFDPEMLQDSKESFVPADGPAGEM